jgi:hypothetical protein
MTEEENLLNFSGKNTIPAEYHTELKTNSYKRALAEMLLKKGMAESKPVQMFGIHAARPSPLAPMIQVLNQRLGMQGLQDADRADTEIVNRAERAQQDDLRSIQNAVNQPNPDIKAAIAQAQLSRYGRTQAYGAELQKQQATKLMEIGKLQGSTDPIAGAKFIQADNAQAPIAPLTILQPEFITTPTGAGAVVTRDLKGGRPVVGYEPKAAKTEVNVDARVGAKTDTELDQETIKMIKKSKDDSADAQSSISAAVRANQLLNQGADAGGGATPRQAARKFAQAFGVNVPETGMTEELRQRLGENVLANARKLAPVTGNDVILLQQLLGSIDTDPDALREINALMLAKGLMTQDKHNKFVESSRAVSSGNPAKYDPFKIERQKLDTHDPALLGRAYQLMQESGHDMSGYSFDGKPVSQASFNIRFTGREPHAAVPSVTGRVPGDAPAGRFKRVP